MKVIEINGKCDAIINYLCGKFFKTFRLTLILTPSNMIAKKGPCKCEQFLFQEAALNNGGEKSKTYTKSKGLSQ